MEPIVTHIVWAKDVLEDVAGLVVVTVEDVPMKISSKPFNE